MATMKWIQATCVSCGSNCVKQDGSDKWCFVCGYGVPRLNYTESLGHNWDTLRGIAGWELGAIAEILPRMHDPGFVPSCCPNDIAETKLEQFIKRRNLCIKHALKYSPL